MRIFRSPEWLQDHIIFPVLFPRLLTTASLPLWMKSLLLKFMICLLASSSSFVCSHTFLVLSMKQTLPLKTDWPMFLYLWAVSATYSTTLCFKCVLSFIILSLRCVPATQLLDSSVPCLWLPGSWVSQACAPHPSWGSHFRTSSSDLEALCRCLR